MFQLWMNLLEFSSSLKFSVLIRYLFSCSRVFPTRWDCLGKMVWSWLEWLGECLPINLRMFSCFFRSWLSFLLSMVGLRCASRSTSSE